jgi:hypothetical protein
MHGSELYKSLKVGDKVTGEGWPDTAAVVHVDGDVAWIKFGDDSRSSCNVADLTVC